MDLKIVTLIEDSLNDHSGLVCEHGLSIYIEINGTKILFDTGQSGIFTKNAKELGIDIKELDYVIFSHGHYDHTGGFKKLVETTGNSFQLIVGQGFFQDRYKLDGDNIIYYVKNNFDEEYVLDHNIKIRYISEDLLHINENIMVVSNFDKIINVDTLNKSFYKKQNNNFIRDEFLDEIALIIQIEKGIIVILGCSHPGIVNMLSTIEKRIGKEIYAVIGGTHLKEADDLMLDQTVAFFKERDYIRFLAMSHCTGEKAVRTFEKEFENRFVLNNTGNVISIRQES